MPARNEHVPGSRRVRRTPEQSLAVVRQALQAYADRRVFAGFSEGRPVAGRRRFRFS